MFSPVAVAHLNAPRNLGKIDGASHFGVHGVIGEGPYAALWLDIRSAKIERAGFECNGCPSRLATMSILTSLVFGMPVERAINMTTSDLLTIVGPLPEGKEYVVDDAVSALKRALTNPVPGIET